MPLIPDTAVFQKRLEALPLASYGAGETVFTEGTRSGIDVIIVRDDKIAALYVFLDSMPS